MFDTWILALIVFLSLVAVIAGFLLHLGLLYKVKVSTGSPPIKNITIAYKFRKGHYKDCGPTFAESFCIAPELRGIVVCYDDPTTVSVNKCRTAVGSIVSEGEEQPDEKQVCMFKKFGFTIISFPEVTHVVSATFPYTSTLSYMLGAQKVYPRLFSYIKNRKLCAHPVLEIYKDNLIHYIVPLARQSDFYVFEIHEKENKDEPEELMDFTDTDTDSDFETSSVSLMPMPESRETSLAPSTGASLFGQEPGDADTHSDHSNETGDCNSSFEQLGLELTSGSEDEDRAPTKEAAAVSADLPTAEQEAVGEGGELGSEQVGRHIRPRC